MTHDEIVTAIADRLNITNTAGLARISREVNIRYKRLTSALGMQLTSRANGIAATITPGSQYVTFSGMEKVGRVYDESSGRPRELDEKIAEQMRPKAAVTSDHVTMWAPYRHTATTVVVLCDVKFQTAINLRADGHATIDQIAGSQEPKFPERFHMILVEAVLQDELRKRGDKEDARTSKSEYEQMLSDLKFWNVKTLRGKRRQGEDLRSHASSGASGTSAGGSVSDPGALSFTITGLWTFFRGLGLAPFAVGAGSAMVANLDVEKLGGLTVAEILDQTLEGPGSSTDNAIPRFSGTAGDTLENTGMTIPDGATGSINGVNTGDVTLAGTPNYITRAAQVLTLALINLASHVTGRLPYANFTAATAASRVLVRRSGSAGDWEEGTLGTGLSLSAAAVLSRDALTVSDLPLTGEWLAENVEVSAGAGSEKFKLSGLIDVDDTQAALASGTEAVLRTFTIPANTLDVNGRTLRLIACGTLAADSDNKVVRVRLGGLSGTVCCHVAQNSASLTTWRAEVYIARIGSGSQRICGRAELSFPASGGAAQSAVTVTTGSATDTGTIDLVVTGEGVNANDVVYEASWVEMFN